MSFKKLLKTYYYEALRFCVIHLAYSFSHVSHYLTYLSERLFTFYEHSYGVNKATSKFWRERSDYLAKDLYILQKSIAKELKAQKQHYRAKVYCEGNSYQGFALIAQLGVRRTEERFLEYELETYLNKECVLYDLGCNCGFLTLYCAHRSGCSVLGVDINPYLVNIATHTAKFLRLKNATFKAQDLAQTFKELPKESSDIILSLATMWTDDAQYRVPLENHLNNSLALLRGGD